MPEGRFSPAMPHIFINTHRFISNYMYFLSVSTNTLCQYQYTLCQYQYTVLHSVSVPIHSDTIYSTIIMKYIYTLYCNNYEHTCECSLLLYAAETLFGVERPVVTNEGFGNIVGIAPFFSICFLLRPIFSMV